MASDSAFTFRRNYDFSFSRFSQIFLACPTQSLGLPGSPHENAGQCSRRKARGQPGSEPGRGFGVSLPRKILKNDIRFTETGAYHMHQE